MFVVLNEFQKSYSITAVVEKKLVKNSPVEMDSLKCKMFVCLLNLSHLFTSFFKGICRITDGIQIHEKNESKEIKSNTCNV